VAGFGVVGVQPYFKQVYLGDAESRQRMTRLLYLQEDLK
jgi:hypothetical protein